MAAASIVRRCAYCGEAPDGVTGAGVPACGAHRDRVLASVLSLHDVRDVEAFVRRIIEQHRHRARLSSVEAEDLISYLVATTWELSARWNPSQGRRQFSHWAGLILPLRIADWYRARFVDTRYYDGTTAPIVDGDNGTLAELAARDDVEGIVIDRLSPLPAGHELSPSAQWVLHEIVAPIVDDGLSYDAIARRLGCSRKRIERLLGELRDELRELEDAA